MLQSTATMKGETRQQASQQGTSWPRTLFRAIWVRDDSQLLPEESSSTLFRFFRSKHVTELRLIFWLGLMGAGISLALIVIPCLAGSPAAGASEGGVRPLLSSYAGPVLTVSCFVIAWAYRSASTRLGVVDLFACEISTICRVGTILDAGKHYVDLYDNALRSANADSGSGAIGATGATGAAPDIAQAPAPPGVRASANDGRGSYSFVSAEQYFPVFDSNARDLQLLEARVVNNIVEFYTYMKATRDCMRKLAALTSTMAGQAMPTAGAEAKAHRIAIVNVIYMLYLANESARLSVRELVEFEPAEAERTVTILVTELRCYALLLRCFPPDDHRCKRLHLRRVEYLEEVDRLHMKIAHHGEHRDWRKARETLQELDERHREAEAEFLPKRS
jgi:hypothetical protein